MAFKEQTLLVLKKWHLVLAIIAAIAVPSATVTATFYKFQLSQAEKDKDTNDRISQLELSNSKAFADKGDLKTLTIEVRTMHDDVLKLKTLVEKNF